MNIIEDWGSGIPRIREELREAGLRDLVIEDWPNAVRVTVYRRLVTSIEDRVTNGVTNGREVANDNVSINDIVLKFIIDNPGVGRGPIAKAIKRTPRTVQRIVDRLIAEKRIVSRGRTKSLGYFAKVTR